MLQWSSAMFVSHRKRRCPARAPGCNAANCHKRPEAVEFFVVSICLVPGIVPGNQVIFLFPNLVHRLTTCCTMELRVFCRSVVFAAGQVQFLGICMQLKVTPFLRYLQHFGVLALVQILYSGLVKGFLIADDDEGLCMVGLRYVGLVQALFEFV